MVDKMESQTDRQTDRLTEGDGRSDCGREEGREGGDSQFKRMEHMSPPPLATCAYWLLADRVVCGEGYRCRV